MGSLHNDLMTWAARARAKGLDRIEIGLETAERISLELCRKRMSVGDEEALAMMRGFSGDGTG